MSRISVCSILGILLFFPFAHKAAFAQPLHTTRHEPSFHTPIFFEPNVGQAETSAGFVARTDKYRLSIGPEGFSFYPNVPCTQGEDCSQGPVTIHYVHGRSMSSGIPDSPQGTVVNYYVGSRDRWRTGVPTYGGVTYSTIYFGVDAKFHGAKDEMEFDFVVRPGASPDIIRMEIAGVKEAIITRSGEVQLANGIAFRPPEAYQIIDGQHRPVSVWFKKMAGLQIGFALGKYDRRQPLIIDPVVSFLTYLGGSSRDEMAGLVVDGSGNIIVLGSTISTDFPTAAATQGVNHGSEDLVISKLNAAGTALIYSTYLGGSQSENAGGIAIDPSGNVYITGTTASTNFPTTSGAYSSGCPGPCSSVAAKLSPSGTLIFSTYLGGIAHAIAVDSQGNSYITGTTGPGLPVVNAFQPTFNGSVDTSHSNAFLTKLDASGTGLSYSTYFGNDGQTNGWAVAVDSSGSAYIAGDSSGVPLKNPLTEDGGAFLTKFSPDGSSLVYSTFLGQGSANSVAVDAHQEPYVLGTTTDSTFPLTGNALNAGCGAVGNPLSLSGPAFCQFPTVFLSKIAADGKSELFSAFLGPGAAGHVALDANGNAFVIGTTNDARFPVMAPVQAEMQQGDPNVGQRDAFVSKVSSGGQLLFSSYLGGNFTDDQGMASAIDASGNLYVGGTTSGSEDSTPDLPIVAPFKSTMTCCGTRHWFLGKISALDASKISLSPRIGPVLEVRNVGSATTPLTITATMTEANNCGSTLAGGGSCQVTVRGLNGTVTISTPTNSQTFAVTGDSITFPLVRLSRNAYPFPAQQIGTLSAPISVIVKNLGAGNSTINSIFTHGDAVQTNDCGPVLAPEQSCSIAVQYSPSNSNLGGTVTVLHDGSIREDFSLYAPAGTPTALIASTGLLNFKTQTVGVSGLTRIVTYTNTSATAISLGAVSITGEFSQTNDCGSTLAPQASCHAIISFLPSSNGNRTGVLALPDNTNGAIATVNLLGTGRIASDLMLSVFDLDFFNQPIGWSFTQPVLVTNVGQSVISFNSITLDPDYSQLNSCEPTVGPTQSCSISITFAPTVVGTRNATLLISHSGMGSPLNVNLTGVGRKMLTVNPTAVDFGSWASGATSDENGISVIGPGCCGGSTVTGVDVTGPFALANNGCSGVIAFNSCRISFTFSPKALGPLSGQASINTTDPSSPYIVNLSGTGADGPLFHLSSPNGGELWQAGTTHTITWTYTGTPAATVNLDLWRNGAFAQTIASNIPVGVAGTGSFGWNIPININVVGNYRVRIASTANNNFRAFSDADFSITAPRQLLLTSPNGPLSLFEGGTQLGIFWKLSGTNSTSSIAVELWKAGQLQSTLTTGQPIGTAVGQYTFGSFTWQVPSDMVAGSNYRIRVRSEQEPDLFDDDDVDLTLYPAFTIAVTSPNGGEAWDLGTTHAITWSFTGNPGAVVQIELDSVTNPANKFNIVDFLNVAANGSSYSWSIPAFYPMDDYRIRIRRVDPPFIQDTSDSDFRLRGTGIIIRAPLAGNVWPPGSSQTIRWIYGNSTPTTVRIGLQKGVATATTLVDNYPTGGSGNGEFLWNVPPNTVIGNDYRIIFFSGGTTTFLAESDSFRIDVNRLTVTSPNGGGLWRPGTVQLAQWFVQGNAGSTVKIDLLKSGSPVAVLATAVPSGQNAANFNVPSDLVAGTDYRVRITSEQDASVTDTSDADFEIADKFQLTVFSQGKVTSDPAGITNCNGQCSAYFPNGTVVTLTASVGPNLDFQHWQNGGCSSNAPVCMVTMNQEQLIDAMYFNPGITPQLTAPVVRITPGKTAQFVLALSPTHNFTGNVTLSCSGLPTGSSCSFVPSATVQLGNEQPQDVNVNVTMPAASPLGVYPFFIGVDPGTFAVPDVPATVEIRDFSLTASPTSLAVVRGASGQITATVNFLGGLSNDIVLGCSSAAQGVTCAANPSTLHAAAGSPQSSAVTVFTDSNTTPTGSATITLTASSIGTTKSANVTLSVRDFSVTANTATVSANVGTNIADTILVKGLNGFTGNVALGCVIVGSPAGMGCTLSNVNPAASSTGTSVTTTITSTAATTPFGTYTVQVTGTNSAHSKMASFTVNIKDFTLATGTGAITLPQPPSGQSSSLTVPITLSAENGFNTSTALSCTGQPIGITCTFSPASGIPTIGGLHSTLTVTSTSAVAPNTYHLTVKATAGALIRTQTLDVTDFGPNFTQAVTPTTANVTAGAAGQYTVTYTSLGGMNQEISVGCSSVLPLGVTCTANPPTVTPGVTPNNQSVVTLQTTFGSTPAANSMVAISGSGIGITRSNNVTLSVNDFSVTANTATVATNVGSSITDTIVVKGLNGFSGNVALSCVIVDTPTGTNCTLSNVNPVATSTGTSVTATISSTAATTPAGSYSVQVIGTAGGSKMASFTVNIKDFTLAIGASAITIPQPPGGQSSSMMLPITSTTLNGFNTSTSLSCTGQPIGITCAFSPASGVPTIGGLHSTLTVTSTSAVAPNTYHLTVKATAGTLIRTQTLDVTDFGPNFTQAVTPTTVNVTTGAAGQYTVTYTQLGGMTQDIAVGCTSVLPPGVICSANPPSVTPGVTPNNQSVVTLQTTFGTTTAGNTTVTIAGVSSALNNLTRTNNVTLSVRDFSVTANSATVATNVGSNITDTILVKGLNGFSGNVALGCVIVGSPAGTGCTFSNVNPAASTAGTSVTATITSTAATTPFGTYTVQVTGTNSAQSKMASFTVNIKDFALAVSPATQTISATGGTVFTDYSLAATSLGVFGGNVLLSCASPLPSGVTCGFGPSHTSTMWITPTPAGINVPFRITVSGSTAPHTYDLKIQGNSSALVRQEPVELDLQ